MVITMHTLEVKNDRRVVLWMSDRPTILLCLLFGRQRTTYSPLFCYQLGNLTCFFGAFAGGVPYVMSHAHVTYMANEWL